MSSGIGALIQVTQLKSQFANEEALHGADKQRDLVAAQKGARERLRAFEDMVRDNDYSTGDKQNVERMLGEMNELAGSSVDTNTTSTGKFEDVEDGAQADRKAAIDGIRTRFEDTLEDLESQDKLGNFEIQDLMSRFNQAETLASSVLKKQDDTKNAVIGKV